MAESIRAGQVWRNGKSGAHYVVLGATQRMANIHTSDSIGRCLPGFTLRVRHASLRRDYEIVHGGGGV